MSRNDCRADFCLIHQRGDVRFPQKSALQSVKRLDEENPADEDFLTSSISQVMCDFEKQRNILSTHCNTHCNMHCNNTLQHAATHCRWYTTCTATHCNTLQHTAPHCTTLHHTAPHCNTLQVTRHLEKANSMHRNTLQHTLQQTASHCNTLQLTAGDARSRKGEQHFKMPSVRPVGARALRQSRRDVAPRPLPHRLPPIPMPYPSPPRCGLCWCVSLSLSRCVSMFLCLCVCVCVCVCVRVRARVCGMTFVRVSRLHYTLFGSHM